MTAKQAPPTYARRRPVPDLEKLGQAIADSRADLGLLQRKIEQVRADIDADLLDGQDTAARHKALRDLVKQERAVNVKLEELAARVAAFDASRLDQVVRQLARAAETGTQRMLEAHRHTLDLEHYQPQKRMQK